MSGAISTPNPSTTWAKTRAVLTNAKAEQAEREAEAERVREYHARMDAQRLEDIRTELKEAKLLPLTATELLETQFAPPEWIVEDLLATRGEASRGFKGDIIAGSKMRKTFFALQLAACVSAGRDFLGVKVPKPRKVLYLNLELREDFAQERIRAMANALRADLGNLTLMSPPKPYLLRNQRDRDGKVIAGHEDAVIEYIRLMGYELIVVDPQYKLELPEEDENSGQGIGGILRWRDRIITETAAACLIVHHDPKSGGTDRDLTQRGAGSSFAGRDYDTRFALDAHADGDPLHEVLECGSRVRPEPEPVTAVFDTGTFIFSVDDSIPAKRLTGDEKKRKRTSDTTSEAARKERERAEAAARAIFNDLDTEATERARKEYRAPAPENYLLNTATFESYLTERASLSDRAAKRQVKILLGKIAGQTATLASVHELAIGKGGKVQAKSGGATYIGLPARVEAYRKSFEDRAR